MLIMTTAEDLHAKVRRMMATADRLESEYRMDGAPDESELGHVESIRQAARDLLAEHQQSVMDQAMAAQQASKRRLLGLVLGVKVQG